jgi:5-oxoprolinase (ATP-hydrolysing) subunit C
MTLHVLDPGLYTLLVDFGRPRSRSLGVPVGGAADRFALALGNALVGNAPDAAALEINLAGPALRAGCELACVVYGAPFALATERRRLAAGTTFTLQPGDQLRIGTTRQGVRAYLCVRGGFQAPVILGSRSGLEPLRAGAELPCLPGRMAARFVRPTPGWNREPRTLRVLDGPHAEWFHTDAFYPQEFRVTPECDRMGLRLHGGPLSLPARDLASEPVCPGSVQVTRDGQCIVLGVDGQTIGGYPKIAQVIGADLDKLGQLRPGERVRFARVTLAEAEALYRQKQAELYGWLVRLRTAQMLPPPAAGERITEA